MIDDRDVRQMTESINKPFLFFMMTFKKKIKKF